MAQAERPEAVAAVKAAEAAGRDTENPEYFPAADLEILTPATAAGAAVL
jgi:transcription elongation GreA/GreB family factor